MNERLVALQKKPLRLTVEMFKAKFALLLIYGQKIEDIMHNIAVYHGLHH